MSETTVDARGLSCPQPVLMAMDQMKKMQNGTFTVLVDAEASRENVIRAAGGQGWEATATEENDGEYHILLKRQ